MASVVMKLPSNKRKLSRTGALICTAVFRGNFAPVTCPVSGISIGARVAGKKERSLTSDAGSLFYKAFGYIYLECTSSTYSRYVSVYRDDNKNGWKKIGEVRDQSSMITLAPRSKLKNSL